LDYSTGRCGLSIANRRNRGNHAGVSDRPSQLDTEYDAGETEDRPRRERVEIARGESLGRYVVLDVIGRGGMGAVYAAYDPELDRKVAIKLILADPSGDAGDQQRLLREAQATAQLNHPNVITVHDVGTHESRVFVAMEFVEGSTMRDWIESGPHPWPAVLERMIAAGRGLAAAHRIGLVHRDFKPANVLVGDDGRLRVADFGLARKVGDVESEPSARRRSEDEARLITSRHSTLASKLTMTGARVGTPAYMAPEQCRGVEVDARADQFGFCVALWEALYGERPFAGDNLAALTLAIEGGEIREPAHPDRAPAWLRRVVQRGLAPDPAARWPDMDALLAALAHDPNARWRSWSIAGTVLLAASVIVAAFALEQPETSSHPCEGAESAFAGTWDDDDRTAITEHFEQRNAKATADVLLPRLDRWAEEWRGQWRDTCEATQVRHEQSEDRFDRRMTCLERRRRRMAGFVDLLRGAEGDLLLDALSGLDRVGSPLACERETLVGHVDPPSDEALRAEVDRLTVELDAVGALLYANDLERVEQEIAALEPKVAATAWAPLQTELLWLRGDLLGRRREFEASERALTEAAESAIAIGDDRLAIEALISQADFVTEWEPRTSESLRLIGVARALAERLDSPPDLLSRIERTRARVHQLDGKLPLSLEAAEKALAHAQKAEAEPGLLTADAEYVISAAYYRMGKYAEGLEHVDRATRLWTATLGPVNGRLTKAHNMRGLYAVAQGRYLDAVAEFEAELVITEARYGKDHLDVSDVLANLSTAHQRGRQPLEALATSERALAIREREVGPDNLYVGHALSNQANILRDLGRLDEALAQAQRARTIILAVRGPEHPEMIIMHVVLAGIHGAGGNHEQAREDLLVALDLLHRPGQANSHFEYSILVGLARNEAALGQAEQALERLTAAEALPDFEPSVEDQADFDWSMAAAQLAGGKPDQARETIGGVIERLEQAGPTHAQQLADVRRWRDAKLP
jgi:serine/threonine protein kinase/tetratricopeptide (TPR) repeat protein